MSHGRLTPRPRPVYPRPPTSTMWMSGAAASGSTSSTGRWRTAPKSWTDHLCLSVGGTL
ncbi:unnamed protein product, partial [Musa textilis]